MASLTTTKVIYNSDLPESVNATDIVEFTIELGDNKYSIIPGQVKCVFYYLSELQWDQGKVAEKVEKDNSNLDLSGYTYYQLGTNKPNLQVKERLNSLGVTVVEDPEGSDLSSIKVSILANESITTISGDLIDQVSDQGISGTSGTSGTPDPSGTEGTSGSN